MLMAVFHSYDYFVIMSIVFNCLFVYRYVYILSMDGHSIDIQYNTRKWKARLFNHSLRCFSTGGGGRDLF